jgi:hypothetical protein
LVLCGARYYDLTTGHWLSRDPIGYAGGQNLYTFCDGNPVNEADPSGTDVTAVFTRSTATLDIWNNNNPMDRLVLKGFVLDPRDPKGKTLNPLVFSGQKAGMNNPKFERDHEQGPIPAGEYLIGPEITKGGHNYNIMRNHFELYGAATDWQYLAPFWDRKNKPRQGLNFHAGWTSDGCVTIFSSIKKGSAGYPGGSTWDQVLSLMRRSGTSIDGYFYRYNHLVQGPPGDYEHDYDDYIPGEFSGVMIVR